MHLNKEPIRETPETDKIYNEEWSDGESETLATLMVDNSEKMERERDAARAIAESLRGIHYTIEEERKLLFPWE